MERRPHHPLVGSVRVNGIRCDTVSPGALCDAVSRFVACGEAHVVNFLSADPTVIAMEDPGYRGVLNRGDLNVADGMSIVWAMRLAGARTGRIAGTDGMRLLTRWSAREGHLGYLYGGAPGVAEAVADRLGSEVSSARFAGSESPPFGPVDPDQIAVAADRIRSTRASLLWVGLGTPKQHLVADRLRTLGAAPVILCVGAAFDFISGAKRRPAAWMQRTGLEWVGRLADEPARLWRRYLVGNARFVAGVARERLGPS